MIAEAIQSPGPSSLDVLKALESPLLDGLAPELVELRAEAVGVAERLEGPQKCEGCARNAAMRALADIAMRINNKLQEDPHLAEVFPALMTSAEQVLAHV